MCENLIFANEDRKLSSRRGLAAYLATLREGGMSA
jgi:hypothetical protein